MKDTKEKQKLRKLVYDAFRSLMQNQYGKTPNEIEAILNNPKTFADAYLCETVSYYYVWNCEPTQYDVEQRIKNLIEHSLVYLD